ncbi:hypothetical protein Tco_1057777 [Tanacetum coccineum]|uniref:Retrovirus-related Pol polyprotein from transposon TNT 1-94-like beta-barrel domain-containing protein n=1 Tax=Tanacetum coccineum TaxID=301880 RepID=A0ABQ5H6D1_9ASTR
MKNFIMLHYGMPGTLGFDCRGLNPHNPQGNVASIQKMITLCIVKQRLQMKAGRDFQIIMVKMHDGTVRTIQDVRHVKGLKKNLLSLGKWLSGWNEDSCCEIKLLPGLQVSIDKEQVENGIIELYFVRTEYQLADMFTKALSEDRFQYLVRRIGMRCLTPAELEVLTNESA